MSEEHEALRMRLSQAFYESDVLWAADGDRLADLALATIRDALRPYAKASYSGVCTYDAILEWLGDEDPRSLARREADHLGRLS